MTTKPKTHFHFIVWAALGRTDNGFTDVTYLDLLATSADEAIARAKELCAGRNYYWVNNILEHHPHTHGEH